MRLVRSVVTAAIVWMAWPVSAQQPAAPPPVAAPAPTPPPQAPVPVAPVAPAPGPAAVLPPATARTFSAPVGMWFLTVRPDRVADFEQVIAHLQASLAKSDDARVRQQAGGWRVLKASEPGPNSTVMYVFLFDPTVPGADYGLGPVLTSVYTDPASLAEIWKMYTGSITGGGSLLNLTPVAPKLVPLGTKTTPVPVPPPAGAPATPPPAAPSAKTPAPPASSPAKPK